MAIKFVFNGTGTRGDLVPMLSIAAEMQQRGHPCRVLGNESAVGMAEELGVAFTPVAPAQTNNLTSIEENFGKYVFASYRPTFEYIQSEIGSGTGIVIVNSEHYAASTLMAERYGLPLCRYILAPHRIFSLEAPCYPLSAKLRGPLGQTFRRYVLPGLRDKRYAHPYVLARMNEFRASLGLAPLSTLRVLDDLVSHRICLFPEWYCPPASDWPTPLDNVGFPLAQPRGELPDDVERWIARHGAPLIFTPGTGVVDVRQFFDAASRCCEILGRPGLFLSPQAAEVPQAETAAILRRNFLDLELVLPRSALLVHHGGIGTTARAIEAGVPQIISPQAFDQPDNGDRVSRLGVGAMLERSRLTGETLAETARVLLESEPTRRSLAHLAPQVRATNAISAMADILERRFLPMVTSTGRTPNRRERPPSVQQPTAPGAA